MRRVVKVGGSLLERPELESQLSVWIAAQPPAETLIVVGGGKLVDAIRSFDQIHPQDATTAHWRCVDLLQVTYEMFRELFSHWQSLSCRQHLEECQRIGFQVDLPTIVAPGAFFDRENDFGVPQNWNTTSDTIAAVLAQDVDADELVLLKSCHVDPGADLPELNRTDVVDGSLESMATNRRIRVEQLPTTSTGF